MKNILSIAALLAVAATATVGSRPPAVDCAFSPRGQILQNTVAAIDAARSTVDVASYSITNEQIAAALLRAHKRNVAVRLIIDPGQEAAPTSLARKLRKAGLPVRTDRRHRLFHNKYIIADATITITGSANHSQAAQDANAENIVTITDGPTALTFTADFDAHWEHAVNFQDRRDDGFRLKPTATPLPSPIPPPTQKDSR